jgi:hypothetical protein
MINFKPRNSLRSRIPIGTEQEIDYTEKMEKIISCKVPLKEIDYRLRFMIENEQNPVLFDELQKSE